MTDERDKVLIVAEFPLLRRGIAAIVGATTWLTVCGETSEPKRARQLCAQQMPRIIVLDLDFRESEGLDLLRELACTNPTAAILALSGREDLSFLQHCFQAGARGYLSKRDGEMELEASLKWLLMWGERYVSGRMSREILEEATSGRKQTLTAGVETLSPRELTVFQMVGENKGPSLIAKELGIHIKTVETHLHRIKIKLGLGSSDDLRRSANRWYLQKGPKFPIAADSIA